MSTVASTLLGMCAETPKVHFAAMAVVLSETSIDNMMIVT